MLSSIVRFAFATVLLASPLATNAAMVVQAPSLSETHQAIFDGWKNFLVDYEGTKKLYAEEVPITVCFAPNPCQTFTGFDDAFGGFPKDIAEIDFIETVLVANKETLAFSWGMHSVTKQGCKIVSSGVAVATFNDEGLVTKYQHFSDNTHALWACLAAEQDEQEL